MDPRRRPPATIVIPVWNRWDQTAPCLQALRPTLGPADRVVVVDNGSTDGTAAGLAPLAAGSGGGWLRVVTNPVNRGFAAACNQGADLAAADPVPDEVVVYLNNDTVPVEGWLDLLLAPLALDPGLGATGPRSNYVSGPQLVPGADYGGAPGSGAHRDWVRVWERRHRDTPPTEVRRLVGFALAVRRRALDDVRGFDEDFGTGGFEDDDLCDRLWGAGWRLAVVHPSYVHHEGHATFAGNGLDVMEVQERNRVVFEGKLAERAGPVLLSACLIVKDEEEALPSCLAALRGVVDEVVVYDTGSTDRTREIARDAGAIVVEGWWDDDFSRARNAALEHCRGRWILHVDADEVLECDPTGLRAALGRSGSWDAIAVDIHNLAGDGSPSGPVHRAVRIFQRVRGHWVGRLHEQVVARPDLGRVLQVAPITDVRLRHSGYVDEVVSGRDKLERNLRLALADAEGRPDDGVAVLNLARALAGLGRFEEAQPHYRRAADLLDPRTIAGRMCLLHATENQLACHDPAAALVWADRLAAASERTEVADFYRAVALRWLGRPEEAWELLAPLGPALRTDDGFTLPDGMLQGERAAVALDVGRPAEAATELLVLIERAADPRSVLMAVEALERAGRGVAVVAGALPEAHLLRAAAALTLAPAPAADEIATALVARFGPRPELLAASVRFAPRLPALAALEWSARLRGIGMASSCPLLARAADPSVAPLERVRAAATAHAAFAEIGRAHV